MLDCLDCCSIVLKTDDADGPLTLFSEHGMSGRLRTSQDPGHRLLRAGHARAAQGEKDLLRHEDPRQTKGIEKRS